jgi:hypothetical protein
MRSRFALVGLVILAACSHAKPDCSKVTVRPVGAASFELPAALEYCLYTPHAAACCRDGGSRCDQIASPAVFSMSSVERAPGCPAR